MSPPVRRSRGRNVRRRQTRPAVVALVGLLVTAAIGGFIWLAEESYNGLPFISYRTLYASLPNIGHLQTHDAVQIAGVKVGQVLRTSTSDGRALVELQLTHVKPLPADTQVLVRDNGLLGDRDVQLIPGTSHRLLANGATLIGTAADYFPSLPDTLNLFDAKTRGALGQMIGGLGEGVLGRGAQLNNAIHVGPPSGVNFNTVAYSILARPGAAARLLPATDAGMTALDAARNDIAGMLAPGATTLRAFIDERTAFDDAIAQAPSALQALVPGLGTWGVRLSNTISSLGLAADSVLPAAPQALRSATKLLEAAPGPLDKTDVVLNQVPTAVPATLQILASLQPDLTPLTNAFTWLVEPVTDLGIHGCDIMQFGEAWRSVLLHGVEPGGPYGPLDGFRAVAATQGLGSLSTIEPSVLGSIPAAAWPDPNRYDPPCKFFPGDSYSAFSLSTLLGVK